MRRAGLVVARLLLAAGLLLAPLPGLTGCGARPYADFEPDVEPGGARPEVTFAATLAPDSSGSAGNRLLVSYRLENTGAVAVVAYNGMQAPGEPAGVSRRDDVYVTARRDGTVEIAKRAYPVPDGADPDQAELLRGTVVAPGARLTEKLAVGIPLSGRRPYLAAATLPATPYDVVFCLGVARLDALEAPVPRPSADGDTDARPLFPHPSPQHLFCSTPLRLDTRSAGPAGGSGDPAHPAASGALNLLAGNLRGTAG